MKNLTFISCALFISFVSCQRDEIINNNPPTAVPVYTIYDFTRFDTGNYWLYKHYTVDSAGEIADADYDSCYYAGDTIISSQLNKKVYFYGIFPADQHLKDSLGYLVNGVPILSTAVVNDTFYVESAIGSTTYYTVTSLTSPFTVPAGTFNDVLDVTASLYFSPPLDTSLNPVISHTYYAKDIGKILEQYHLSGELFQHQNIIHERRLIGYFIN